MSTTVELYLGGVWTDITAYVYTRDAIVIRRGRADESSSASPAECRLTLNNRDGRFSPRNPIGPYYGSFGRNSLIRVTADITGTPSIRFQGEVASWPPEWDYSETDVWVPIAAVGIRRRLARNSSPIRGALERASLSTSGLAGYWPMSDPEGSTVFASAGAGVAALVPLGAIDYASNTTAFPLQPALPLFSSASALATLPAVAAGDFQLGALVFVPSGLGALTHSLLTIVYSGGGVGYAELGLLASTGQLALSLYTSAGAFIVGATTGVVDDIRNRAVRVQVGIQQNGAAVDLKLGVAEGGSVTTYTDSIAATTIGVPVSVGVGYSGAIASRTPLTGVYVGQLLAADSLYNPVDYLPPLDLWAGEFADARILRLCTEEGVSLLAGGPTLGGGGVPLGPQLPGTLLGLLDEAADADLGVLTEQVDGFGLVYTVGVDLYDQAATATLDYSGEQLNTFTPVEDDQVIVNDMTVDRIGGSSARYVLEIGPLSIQDPPDGVGRYDDSKSLSLEDDDQLPDQASFRVRLGTIDEARYPAVGLDLVTSGTSNADIDDLLSLREGDRFDVLNPLALAGAPDDIRQLVAGWSERISSHTWQLTLVGIPASAYDVGVYDDDGDFLSEEPGSRYSPDSCQLVGTATTTATTLDVETFPLWTTDPAQYPFDLNVAGERITVTACLSTGFNDQTFTCVRSVNGVVKAHASLTPVALWQPARYAMWRG